MHYGLKYDFKQIEVHDNEKARGNMFFLLKVKWEITEMIGNYCLASGHQRPLIAQVN